MLVYDAILVRRMKVCISRQSRHWLGDGFIRKSDRGRRGVDRNEDIFTGPRSLSSTTETTMDIFVS